MRRRPFIATLTGAVGAGTATRAGAWFWRRGGSVEILTDEYGVSHVYADDLYELGFGNGYVQARDRLFQLDALRLVGRGESAQLQGPGQLSSDVQVTRDLYDRSGRTEQWEAADEEIREAIRGFTDGVNERLEEVRDTWQMPGEFDFLDRDPEPWEPQDTIAIVNYTIGFFGVGGGSELTNARRLATMFDRMGGEGAAWQAYGDLNRRIVPDDHYGSLTAAEVEPTDERQLAYDEVPDDQLAAIRAAADAEPWGVAELDLLEAVKYGLRDAIGITTGGEFNSNAIIVGGEHTETGRPMLAGGPQMGLFKPPVVHEIGLHGDGFDAAGIGVVGTPAIVVGRTPDFAWTVTTSGDDMVDTIAVELDPDDRYRYRWDGEWHEIQTETVVHEADLFAGLLEGELEPAKVIQEVAWIEQADTELPVIAWNEEANVAYCQRVSTRKQELDGVFRWAEIARADDLAEVESQLSEFPFGFNFHVVDGEAIAYYRTGKLPNRSEEIDPRFPVPADRHRWDGVDEGIVTSAVEPERGYVVNWNNAPAPGWGHSDAEVQWGSLHRVDVMERLTQEAIEHTGGALSLGDVEGIIEDCSVEHPFAPRSVPHLVAAGLASADEQLQAMALELERWADTDFAFRPGEDGRYPDGGMAIWEESRRVLQDLVFEDELGEHTPGLTFDPGAGDGLGDDVDPHAADHGVTNTWDRPLVEALEGRTEHQWLPPVDGGGSHADRRLAVCQEALRQAAADLEERFETPDPSEWRLPARQSVFTPLGGAVSSEVPMTNRATYQQAIAMHETGADAGSVLPPSNTGQLRFGELVWAQLFDTEPDRLTDQLELYANFDYKPHPVTREAVERYAEETSHLDPP